MVAADPKSQDKIDVLIVADCFHPKLIPLTSNVPFGLFSIASISLIDLTLEWVSRIDANVYIAWSNKDKSAADEIKARWKTRNVNLEFLVCENCNNFGDLMRAVDKFHLFTKDFILIESLPAFSSTNLTSSLQSFKDLRKKDKNNVMAIVCKKSTTTNVPWLLDSANKLVAYNSQPEDVVVSKKEFSTGRLIRSDLKNAGIYFCGAEVLAQFSDNFDLHTLDSVIATILINEEILCQAIHVLELTEDFAEIPTDADSLLKSFWNLLHLTFLPIALNAIHPSNSRPHVPPFHLHKQFVYTRPQIVPPVRAWTCAFGGHFDIAEDVVIRGGLFDDGVVIGEGSQLAEVIVGKNVRIGKNVSISKAIINDDVEIKDNECVSGFVGFSKKVPEEIVRKRLTSRQTSGNSNKEATGQKLDAVYETTGVGLMTFNEEVRESMRHALELNDWESEDQQKKLILEINSSKLAYNISMDDVAKYVFLSFMSMPKFGPKFADMRSFAASWKHVWNNYYRPDASKFQLLHAIEEYAASHPDWAKFAPKFVHCLYDELELLADTVIVDWYEDLPENHCLRNAEFDRLIEFLRDDEEDEDDEE